MGGGTFVSLKTGPSGRKSPKQAETGLASLRKVLWIDGAGESAGGRRCIQRLSEEILRWIWLIRAEIHARVSWFTILAGEMAQYLRKNISRAG
jgi:hypothetical protein